MAETIRHTGATRLARMSNLLSNECFASMADNLQHDVEEIASLYRQLDAIEQLCSSTVTSTTTDRENRSSSSLTAPERTDDAHPDQRIQTLSRLEEAIGRFNEQSELLESRINTRQRDIIQSHADQLPELLAALSQPGGTAIQRSSAWRQAIHLSAGAAIPESHASVDRGNSDFQHHSELQCRTAATWIGRLAVCRWPDKTFDELVEHSQETHAQVLHRLEILASESQWWLSLQAAGRQIGIREHAARQISVGTQSVVGNANASRDANQSKANGTSANAMTIVTRMALVPPLDCESNLQRRIQHDFADYLVWRSPWLNRRWLLVRATTRSSVLRACCRVALWRYRDIQLRSSHHAGQRAQRS
ncbi:MAG: hypothetical protein R3C05_30085 [Pirellulaceae bacterium]